MTTSIAIAAAAKTAQKSVTTWAAMTKPNTQKITTTATAIIIKRTKQQSQR